MQTPDLLLIGKGEGKVNLTFMFHEKPKITNMTNTGKSAKGKLSLTTLVN